MYVRVGVQVCLSVNLCHGQHVCRSSLGVWDCSFPVLFHLCHGQHACRTSLGVLDSGCLVMSRLSDTSSDRRKSFSLVIFGSQVNMSFRFSLEPMESGFTGFCCVYRTRLTVAEPLFGLSSFDGRTVANLFFHQPIFFLFAAQLRDCGIRLSILS